MKKEKKRKKYAMKSMHHFRGRGREMERDNENENEKVDMIIGNTYIMNNT